ncbi:unnamed protein product [Schistosoma margrebowiei]|uniref:Uncharacterized protein n=1 Tax=Schistosoma margrebowiei TaxID=48269 RepID=A0A183LPM8_9TREM|nr:unnamed protein product [Schistosoma margrebowiei]
MEVGDSRQETLNPRVVLLGTRQQGVPVILRDLVLPSGFDLVSPSFTELSELSGNVCDCEAEAPDSLDNVNDLTINVFIYASDRNDNVKTITRDFNYPGTNWNNSSFPSCNDECSLINKMNCRL